MRLWSFCPLCYSTRSQVLEILYSVARLLLGASCCSEVRPFFCLWKSNAIARKCPFQLQVAFPLWPRASSPPVAAIFIIRNLSSTVGRYISWTALYEVWVVELLLVCYLSACRLGKILSFLMLKTRRRILYFTILRYAMNEMFMNNSKGQFS